MVFKFLRELSQFLIVKVRVIAGFTTFPVSTLFVVVAFTLFFSVTSGVIEAFRIESGPLLFRTQCQASTLHRIRHRCSL